MADTLTNPYLQMGLLNMMQPNKYLNPAYQGKPLPMPGFYTGTAGAMGPTDAMGNIIPSFTQANNAAQSAYQQQLAAFNAGQPSGGAPQGILSSSNPINSGAPTDNSALINYMTQQNANIIGSPASLNQGGFGAGNGVLSNNALMNIQSNAQMRDSLMAQQNQAAPAAAPTPPSPPDLRQAYLDALAAPQGIGNNMPTPGAQGVQSPPPQLGQPSVLDSFLANNRSSGGANPAAAGNYNNSQFFNTLNRLNSKGGPMAAQNQQPQGPSLGMNVAAPSMGMPSMGMPSAGMPTNRNLIGVG